MILRILFIGEGPSDSGIATHISRIATNYGHAAVITDPLVERLPIRMTEAWLLLDVAEIRRVAGAPNDRTPLDLPKAKNVESIADPKELLKHTLARASGLSGRRLEQFNKRFPSHRRQLLDRVDPEGPICQVPSWCAFNEDLAAGLKAVHA